VTRNYIEGELVYGVTNIGFKPTVNGHHLLAETNLFNFYKDVYDRMMKIELLDFIRPEKKFGSVMELQSEMENNILYAKNYVKKRFN
ncbi:MAG: riboflavin kinase, partial [Lachnospiraceae bacterium]|nr:riboflavin kinase [Lachnospiraceae bacterium]